MRCASGSGQRRPSLPIRCAGAANGPFLSQRERREVRRPSAFLSPPGREGAQTAPSSGAVWEVRACAALSQGVSRFGGKCSRSIQPKKGRASFGSAALLAVRLRAVIRSPSRPCRPCRRPAGRHAARELREPLLELLLVVVGGRLNIAMVEVIEPLHVLNETTRHSATHRPLFPQSLHGQVIRREQAGLLGLHRTLPSAPHPFAEAGRMCPVQGE